LRSMPPSCQGPAGASGKSPGGSPGRGLLMWASANPFRF